MRRPRFFVNHMLQGTIEEKATIDMTADVPVDVLVEYTNTSPANDSGEISAQPALMLGVVRIYSSSGYSTT
jgi:hypothetical protein